MYMILRPKLFDMEMEIFQFTPEMARNISQKLGIEFFRTHIVETQDETIPKLRLSEIWLLYSFDLGFWPK